jgi:thymidine phosphorylase
VSESFNAVDLIKIKRDGNKLSPEQITWLIEAYMRGGVADEQVSALLMAIVWRGLDPNELSAWTTAMIESGSRLDLSSVDRPTIGKHSTGGVGDKVSLILAPMIAACGVAVPKLSGRGLGHTGGTLDKLESIPGFRSDLTAQEMIATLNEVGCVICAAGGDLAPADRKLYALRDVTGTVESIPLLASSIMSKKIAEGTGALVLDVKVGSGAFLPHIEKARVLANTMVRLGRTHGVETTAVLTEMDAPLGRAAGNALEVRECIDVLMGGGPQDLIDVSVALAGEMLKLVGIEAEPEKTLKNGLALDRFEAMVRAQGGDPRAELPLAAHKEKVAADRDGFINRVDARSVGIAAWRLGAGRARKEDPVSAAAGVVTLKKPGDMVRKGEDVLELHFDDEVRLPSAIEALDDAIDIADEPPERRPMVIERIGS